MKKCNRKFYYRIFSEMKKSFLILLIFMILILIFVITKTGEKNYTPVKKDSGGLISKPPSIIFNPFQNEHETSATSQTDLSAPQKPEMNKMLAKIEPAFIKNRGQIKNDSVRYYLTAPGRSIYLTEKGFVLDLYRTIKEEHPEDKNDPHAQRTRREGVVVKAEIVNGKPELIRGKEYQKGRVNYFIGGDKNRWKKNIPTFKNVLYESIYPFIDLRFSSSASKLKYQFEVRKGGNPKNILVRFEGIECLSFDKNQNLVIQTERGQLIDEKPYVYQDIFGNKTLIDAQFELRDKNTYSFIIGKYDKNYTLIIDPCVEYRQTNQ